MLLRSGRDPTGWPSHVAAHMRVLLIWPKSRNEVLGWGDLGAIAEPLSLEYLAAAAQVDGHEVQVLDLRLHPGDLDDTLGTFVPDVVGVTAFSMHVRAAAEICRTVKRLVPGCRTVIGGHHASFLPEDFFKEHIDFVVTGEGVQPFRTLLTTLQSGEREVRVRGMWTARNGRFEFGGEQPPFDLNTLPQPDRTVTARDRSSYFIDWMKPVALVRTTVGCPYRCSFCSLWKIMDGRYHIRDIDSVVQEMQSIEEEFVFLVDDEAFIHGRRMRQLASALAAAGMHKRYFAYCRMDSIVRERDVLKEWRRIGLERLFVGVDAITDQRLGEFNKRMTSTQIEEGYEVARDLGIEIFSQFVVGPDYTRQDFRRLVRFIEHHRITYPTFTILTPIPGTAMLANFDQIVERQPDGRPNWDLFDCQNAVVPTTLPRDEFRREYRNLYRVFKGAYAQYREHPRLVDDTLSRELGTYVPLHTASRVMPLRVVKGNHL
jgi:radical SAM superfamily enzyme YgiQ (UPF0313 family)